MKNIGSVLKGKFTELEGMGSRPSLQVLERFNHFSRLQEDLLKNVEECSG